MNMTPLSAHFATYFKVALAYTPEQIAQAQSIRYDVYCREFHFEKEENCPGGLETDDYDHQAMHCVVLHKASNTPAGCVRLIKIPVGDPALLLPLERYCGSSLTHPTLHPRLTPRQTVCEISRLAVHTNFRRRPGESLSPFGSTHVQIAGGEITEQERRTFPLISVALIAASTAMMVLSQRPNLFIMVEQWLAILLRRLGLAFEQIGEVTNYHGSRAAYYIHVDQMLQGMKGDLRNIYHFVYSSLSDEVIKSKVDFTI